MSLEHQPSCNERVVPLTLQMAGRRVLSSAEEVALAKRIERGDLAAKERMIESNLRLVWSVARRYRGRGVPFADLVQEGTVGLVRAVERFDHRRGFKFSTYAVWWIRRSIVDAIAAAQLIRIPTKAAQQLAAVRHAESELARCGPGCANDGAVAELTGREEFHEVTTMLRRLPKRHREVVMRRYGLADHRVQSHEEIGRLLGVGEERSRQIEREALHRLRTIVNTSARAA